MANFLPLSIQKLIEEFSRLPGVGPKSAQRLTMHLLHSPEGRLHGLSEAVSGLKKGLMFCRECWNIAENELCMICGAGEQGTRNKQQICVVEEVLDTVALERMLEYKGVYHVLHGALSPVDGIGPDQLKIEALVMRVKALLESEAGSQENFDPQEKNGLEIILATNPGMEGETTALYLLRLLKPLGVKITRIARGLPVGGDLDYADEMTLSKAMQGRAEYQ